jgi:2-polyprenyl-3-methyl-5-hydroxy-6-metoxy-1,4-benzoquinol methylase
VYDDDNKPIKPIRFDLITAWEVIEHIELRDMDTFFYNIWQHLNQVGIFCGTISLVGDLVDGVQLHSTIMSEQNWYRYFERLALFEMHNSLIKNRVRQETTSIFIVLQKIDKISTEHLYLVEPDLYKHFRSV